MPDLLAVPNVSTAGDAEVLRRLGEAFGRRARVLDVHTDTDPGRTVFTLAGEAGGAARSPPTPPPTAGAPFSPSPARRAGWPSRCSRAPRRRSRRSTCPPTAALIRR